MLLILIFLALQSATSMPWLATAMAGVVSSSIFYTWFVRGAARAVIRVA